MLEERISQVTIRGSGTLGLRPAVDPLPEGFGITHRWEAYTANVEPGDTFADAPLLPFLPDLIGTADMVPNAMGSVDATGPALQLIGGQVGLGFGAPKRLMTPLIRSHPHTLVALVRPRVEPYTDLSVILGAQSTSGARGSVYIAGGKWSMNAGQGLSTDAAVKGGQWQVLTAVFNGASSALRVDGEDITGNAGSETADRLILGSFALLGAPTVMYLASVYYAPVAWTLTQRADFEAWLREINQLPAA